MHTGPIYKQHKREMLVPVCTTPFNPLRQHIRQCSVEPLDEAIRLGVIGRGIYLLDPQHLTHLCHASTVREMLLLCLTEVDLALHACTPPPGRTGWLLLELSDPLWQRPPATLSGSQRTQWHTDFLTLTGGISRHPLQLCQKAQLQELVSGEDEQFGPLVYTN